MKKNCICQLCKKQAALHQSHVISRFIVQDFKDYSTTGRLGDITTPNLPAQDGPKAYLMCSDCEQLIGQYESEFAARIYHPFVEDREVPISYGPWLLKFCVSTSWRTLKWSQRTDPLIAGCRHLDRVEDTWRRFLLYEDTTLLEYPQHLFPVKLARTTVNRSIVNLGVNKFIQSTIVSGIFELNTQEFVYVKIPYFYIVGIVRMDKSESSWAESEVLANGGQFPVLTTLPETLKELTRIKLHGLANAGQSISEKRRQNIIAKGESNSDRVARSRFKQAQKLDRVVAPKRF